MRSSLAALLLASILLMATRASARDGGPGDGGSSRDAGLGDEGSSRDARLGDGSADTKDAGPGDGAAGAVDGSGSGPTSCPSACASTGTECIVTGSTHGSACTDNASCCCSDTDPTCGQFSCFSPWDGGGEAGSVCCPVTPVCASGTTSDMFGCTQCKASPEGTACHTNSQCGVTEYCTGATDSGPGICCNDNADCFYGTTSNDAGCPVCLGPGKSQPFDAGTGAAPESSGCNVSQGMDASAAALGIAGVGAVVGMRRRRRSRAIRPV